MDLESLNEKLKKASSVYEKNEILDNLKEVRQYLDRSPAFQTFLAGLSPECELSLKQVVAIGQAARIFSAEWDAEKIRALLMQLLSVDSFYREMGGIIGYQAKVMQLLRGAEEAEKKAEVLYHSPIFIEILEETDEVNQAIEWGIDALAEMAEFYPLGGAADRLHLVDENTGQELPAAKLPFAGRPLIAALIRDLQAREYLYYKKYGIQLTTPIAIMTSHEKGNHRHVEQILSEANWFGRPSDSFRLFTQPLVPTVNRDGDWCLVGPMKPLLKPGGHGAIWKLARDQGIFEWLAAQGRKKALVRQINNPIAGLDYGLLAFTGVGWKKKMKFGFASCPRLLSAAEGVNVLIERQGKLALSNVEYCDFAKYGIADRPLKEGEPYSRFSSNTNILFADLQEVSKAVSSSPFPGLLINIKPTKFTLESGDSKEEAIGRLESTMQNIADVFTEERQENGPLKTVRTFVTYNKRHKTISTAKKAYLAGKSLLETPENCFYDLMKAARELLEKECCFHLPSLSTIEETLRKGPDFVFLYHPAFGPLYSIIRKKLRGGSLARGSEFVLEIAEATVENLALDGSLRVIAEQPLGANNCQGQIGYSNQVGRCILKNVTVKNRGVDWANSKDFWKMNLHRPESLTIILRGKSLFHAENVHFEGNQTIILDDGQEMRSGR